MNDPSNADHAGNWKPEDRKIIPPTADEIETMKRMHQSATLSLAVVLGQMWAEHKKVDSDDKPVEFAISLRSSPAHEIDGGGTVEQQAMFRAEAMWMQKWHGEEKTFHAHGPPFGAVQLNEGINITTMFASLVDAIKQKQLELEKEQN